MSTLGSYLISWACNPILDQLVWFIEKSKQFNHSNITIDIVALTLMLSVNRPLNVFGGFYSHLSGCFWLFAPKVWEVVGDLLMVVLLENECSFNCADNVRWWGTQTLLDSKFFGEILCTTGSGNTKTL